MDNDGKFSFKIVNNAIDSQKDLVIYYPGNDIYDGFQKTIKINVIQIPTKVSITQYTYGDKYLKFSLKTHKGNGVSGSVTISIDGKKYNVVNTNVKGVYSLKAKSKYFKGKSNIKVEFGRTFKYISSSNSIKIKQMGLKLTNLKDKYKFKKKITLKLNVNKNFKLKVTVNSKSRALSFKKGKLDVDLCAKFGLKLGKTYTFKFKYDKNYLLDQSKKIKFI